MYEMFTCQYNIKKMCVWPFQWCIQVQQVSE